MRRIPIAMIRPGMKVGLPIYNSRGDILVHQNVLLTQSYIERLKKHHIPALYIIDDLLPVVEISDLITERTRLKAINNVRVMLSRLTDSMSLTNEDEDNMESTIEDLIQELFENKSLIYDIIDIRSTDEFLFGHCVNVSVLALITGLSMDISKHELSVLGLGAILHDIGKSLLPEDLLNKESRLTAEEFELIKKHSEYGYNILCSKKEFNDISRLIVRQHHERINGYGYPDGLSGKDIHLYSQIVGIADMYDAMTSDRAYRKAIPVNKVYQMLSFTGGYLFELSVVQNFLRNIAAFPKGAIVLLNSGQTGIVMETRIGLPLHPTIKVITEENGKPIKHYDIEMSKDPSISIVKVLDHDEIEKLKKAIKGN